MSPRKPSTGRSKRKRPTANPDANQTAYALVQAITGADPVKGEDLLGSPELRKQLLEAKAADAARQRTKGRVMRRKAAGLGATQWARFHLLNAAGHDKCTT